MNQPSTLYIFLFFFCALGACSDTNGGLSAQQLFSAEVSQVTIEVDYQTGADPRLWSFNLGDNPWSVFKTNANALFQGAPRSLQIPDSISEMQELTDLTDTTFTADEVFDLANANRQHADTSSSRSFYYLFLNGKYADSLSPEGSDSVLGISIEGTGIIALFRPVIDSFESPDLVETIAVTHEFGHAVGLVNSGLPLASAHHDAEHGAHCTNPECVMYYQFESGRSIGELFDSSSFGSDQLLFGQECLGDARNASQ